MMLLYLSDSSILQVTGIAEAIDYLHANEIIHMAIEPVNALPMLTSDSVLNIALGKRRGIRVRQTGSMRDW